MRNLLITLIFFSFLTNLTSQIPGENAESLIAAKLSESDNPIKDPEFKIKSDYLDDHNNVRVIHALQQYNGIYVHEGLMTLNVNNKGETIVNDEFKRLSVNTTQPAVNHEDAIMTALDFHGLDVPEALVLKEIKNTSDSHHIYERGTIAASDLQVRLTYIQLRNEDMLRLTWETQLHTPDRQHYWVSYVDVLTGRVIDARDYVISCQFGEGLVYDNSPEEEALRKEQMQELYRKSAADWDAMAAQKQMHQHDNLCSAHEHPASLMAPVNSYQVLDHPAEAPNDTSATSTQTFVATDGDPIASQNGWTSDEAGGGVTQHSYTRGNNVWAFHDPNVTPLGGTPQPATSAQATSGPPGTGPFEFHYAWDLNDEPETPNNRAAAIVNLFYWNNLIHDVFFHHGFTEAGRNFQTTNFSGQGVGNDEVWAQAQDGGGTNNANFLTLNDGVNGQMQMYIWTPGSLDSTVQISTVAPPAPSVMAGDKFIGLQGALYNTAAPPPSVDIYNNPVSGEFVIVNDGCGSSEGCGAGGGAGLPPCNDVTGKIVLIDRGTCSFVEKVHGAQLGNAVGVIIMNNNVARPDEVIAMGGTDPTINTITIPAVMCSYNTGQKLKAAIAGGSTINGMLKNDNPPQPKRDGDFDNGIIAHEYGHGISSRTSPQTAVGGSLGGDEQGGEGWSDYYALFLTTTASDLGTPTVDHPNGVLPEHGIGTYVTYDGYDGAGIRPRRYSTDFAVNEFTFAGSTNGGKGVTSGEITIPHGVGFIWCTMLWDLTQAFIDEYGFYNSGGSDLANAKYNPPVTGNIATDLNTLVTNSAGNSLALKLIQKGIELQTTSPRMTDMRDGILAADTMFYGGYHSCLIYEAFANRGLGSNTINPTNNLGDEVDGYGVPTACNPVQVYYDIVKTGPVSIENHATINYTIDVTNTSPTGTTGIDIEVIDIMAPELTFISAGGAPFVVNGDTITFTIASIDAGVTVPLTVETVVDVEKATARLLNYDFEIDDAQGWISVPGGANNFTLENNAAEAHGGETYFYCTNTGLATSGPALLLSPMLNTAITNRQIRFWHHWDTDSGYDGGYLEYTADDGVTWTRLPLQTNPYNGDLNSTFNPTGAGAAFTGSNPDYIESAGLIPDGASQVRFVFSEDAGGVGGDGWWIDDVRIVVNPIDIHNVAHVDDPQFSGGRTHTSVASTLILNNICDDIDLLINEGIIVDGTEKYVQNMITMDGVSSDVILNSATTAEFRAGDNILVQKNLDIKAGAELLLGIEDCDD